MFFWLWIAALVSNIGTWMQNVGAAWLMTSLSPSPLLVALIQPRRVFRSFYCAAGGRARRYRRSPETIDCFPGADAAAGALSWLTILH